MKTAKQFLGLIIFLGLSLSAISQEVIVPTKENTHEADSGKVFDSSEINPSFPGGMQAQMTFLANNIVYPEIAKEQGIQGTVFVNFIAEKDGRLTHIKILRGVSTEIDQEVIRVVKKMPRWEAGTNKGETVRVRLNMPVKFSLQTDIIPQEDILIVGGDEIEIAPDDIEDDNNEDEIYVLVEDNAGFPGGDDALRKYLKDHIQYPEMAKKNGTEGRVYVKFVVEKDGSITNIKVLRGIGSGCDEEAVRVVSNMPKWNPGKQRRKVVRQYFNIPVKFSLEADISPEEVIIIETEVEPSEETDKDNNEDEIFVFVEDNASFPGGVDARMKYLRENLKYPKMAIESGIQGTVYLKFVVEKDGSITNVKVLRGIGGGCDEEAMRVVKNMPKWNPAKQRGKPVRVQFNMPIKFVLSGGKTKKLSKREQKKLDKQKRKEAKHRE